MSILLLVSFFLLGNSQIPERYLKFHLKTLENTNARYSIHINIENYHPEEKATIRHNFINVNIQNVACRVVKKDFAFEVHGNCSTQVVMENYRRLDYMGPWDFSFIGKEKSVDFSILFWERQCRRTLEFYGPTIQEFAGAYNTNSKKLTHYVSGVNENFIQYRSLQDYQDRVNQIMNHRPFIDANAPFSDYSIKVNGYSRNSIDYSLKWKSNGQNFTICHNYARSSIDSNCRFETLQDSVVFHGIDCQAVIKHIEPKEIRVPISGQVRFHALDEKIEFRDSVKAQRLKFGDLSGPWIVDQFGVRRLHGEGGQQYFSYFDSLSYSFYFTKDDFLEEIHRFERSTECPRLSIAKNLPFTKK